MERVGRYHPSRLILCAVRDGRETLDATVHLSASGGRGPGEIAVGREQIVLKVGSRHLKALDTIVDPLLVHDLTVAVWAPHGHSEGVDALRRLVQIVLLDSQDAPTVSAALARAVDLSDSAYVVDLAWLRSTPWRERIAAAFDPPTERAQLRSINSVTVRHRDDSLAAAVLFCGWLSSRLGWKPGSLSSASGNLTGHARSRREEVKITLKPVDQDAPGLAGVTIETSSGAAISLDRSPGGLRSVRRTRDGEERSWTVLGASRGEGGILGEGVRQALLRDPTYRPALDCGRTFVS
jgi:glucose-6-phosphate dehydrogenase assembly protein OpcA